MKFEEVKEFLRNKPGYAKIGGYKLSLILETDEEICQQALKEVRRELKNKFYSSPIVKDVSKFQELKTSQGLVNAG